VHNDSYAENLADQALAAWEADDSDRAEGLWREAAGLGSSRAMVNLGRNRADDDDLNGASKWFLAAVEQGDAEGAILMAGVARLRGDSDGEEAWSWRAADLGHGPMLLQLAMREPDSDPSESFNVALMLKAGDAGSDGACGMMCVRAFNREQYGECVEWGLRAFELVDEDTDPSQEARLHSVVASAYLLMDDPLESLRHYEIGVGLDRDAVHFSDDALQSLRQAVRELEATGTGGPTVGHTGTHLVTHVPNTPADQGDDVAAARLRTLTKPATADLGAGVHGDFTSPRGAPTARAAAPATGSPSASGSARFCIQCGEPRNTETRFCTNCGQAFTPTNPQTTAVAEDDLYLLELLSIGDRAVAVMSAIRSFTDLDLAETRALVASVPAVVARFASDVRAEQAKAKLEEAGAVAGVVAPANRPNSGVANGFRVILEDAGTNVVAVIREVRKLTGLGLAESKSLVFSAPCTVATVPREDDADQFTQALNSFGATVRVERHR
jgi:ribosomal protein L7/L12